MLNLKIDTTNKILIGSRYFFEEMDGFNPHDSDYICLHDDPSLQRSFIFKVHEKDGSSTDYMMFFRKSKEEMIKECLDAPLNMTACKFIVPEFCKEFGIELNDILILKDKFNSMDKRHWYTKLIFDFYIENGGFYLTEKQLNIAYEDYLNSRR